MLKYKFLYHKNYFQALKCHLDHSAKVTIYTLKLSIFNSVKYVINKK